MMRCLILCIPSSAGLGAAACSGCGTPTLAAGASVRTARSDVAKRVKVAKTGVTCERFETSESCSCFDFGNDIMSWACPRCHRSFRAANQRHACGVGRATSILKDRSPKLVDLYRQLEASVRAFGDVEVVTRDRYALFRTTRIFVDLTVMRDALRVVIHLGRKASSPRFIKVGTSGKRVSHVALVRTAADLRAITPFLREAFDLAASEDR
jgi:predicted transport protein